MKVDTILKHNEPIKWFENSARAKVKWLDKIIVATEYAKANSELIKKLKRNDMPEEVKESLNRMAKAGDEFFDWVVGLYGAIPVIYKNGEVDAVATLKSSESFIYRDEEISRDNLRKVFQFFTYYSWSTFSDLTQSKGNKYNSGVPLFLYGQRLYNNVPYSVWQKQIPAEGGYLFILGRTFSDLIDFELDSLSPWVSTRKAIKTEEFEDIRRKATLGISKGVKAQQSYIDYRANITGNKEFDSYPKLYRMMILQLWIFNAQVRNNNMILDWWDWDNVPEGIDSSISKNTNSKDRLEKLRENSLF